MENNIKKIRLQKNLTKARLAKMLGVSVKTLTSWEDGKTAPRIIYAYKMAVALNVSVDYLVGLKDN